MFLKMIYHSLFGLEGLVLLCSERYKEVIGRGSIRTDVSKLAASGRFILVVCLISTIYY